MKLEKTRYKGVYFDPKTSKYAVQTTFTTKDKVVIKKCKRGFTTAKQANEWKSEMSVFFANNIYTSDLPNTNVSFNDRVFNDYFAVNSKSFKTTTIKNKRAILKKYLFSNISKNINELDSQDIMELYTKILNSGLTPNSINTIFTNLRAFFEYLDLYELINVELSRKLKRTFTKVKVLQKPGKSFITKDEFKLLYDNFGDINPFYQTLLKLLFYTGLRISEALGITYADIDQANKTISVNKQVVDNTKYELDEYSTRHLNCIVAKYTKTNIDRVVTITEDLLVDIMNIRNIKDSNDTYVFATSKRFVSRENFYYHLKMKSYEFLHKKLTVHGLRHSHITLLFENNLDAKYIADRVGHSSERTSMEIYEHLTDNKKNINDKMLESLFKDL